MKESNVCVGTGDELPSYNHCTTTDGRPLSKALYDEMSIVLCKGLFSSDEVLRYVESKKKYLRLYKTYGNTMVSILMQQDNFGKKGILELVKKEEEMAIQRYGKVRSCLSMQEHYEILEELMIGKTESSSDSRKLNHWNMFYSVPVTGVSIT